MKNDLTSPNNFLNFEIAFRCFSFYDFKALCSEFNLISDTYLCSFIGLYRKSAFFTKVGKLKVPPAFINFNWSPNRKQSRKKFTELFTERKRYKKWLADSIQSFIYWYTLGRNWCQQGLNIQFTLHCFSSLDQS